MPKLDLTTDAEYVANLVNVISISSAVFAQLTTERPYTLQWAALPPLIALPMGIWTPSNTWFLGPTRVLNANSIGSAVFAGLLL